MFTNSNTVGNWLLDSLSQEEYQRLAPHLELVKLESYEILHEPAELIQSVYFPVQALVSLVAIGEDGSTVEVSLVGYEGMVGMPCILGGQSTTVQAIVQHDGTAFKMSADVLRSEFERGGALQKLLLIYTQVLITQISQGVVCNRLHTLEERLARWLLSVSDRVRRNEFFLTQEFIAQMLGTRRSGVTVAAGTLQRAGIIRYSRGRIAVLNRDSLESVACECYRIIKDESDRLLNSPKT